MKVKAERGLLWIWDFKTGTWDPEPLGTHAADRITRANGFYCCELFLRHVDEGRELHLDEDTLKIQKGQTR